MKVLFVRYDVVDCTADPHPVDYEDLNAALEAIQLVCESSLVQQIASVSVAFVKDNKQISFASDWLTTVSDEKSKKQSTKEAIVNKTGDLYFRPGLSESTKRMLPMGLKGVSEAIKKIKKNPKNFPQLSIGVVWKFAGDASCSDYITFPAEESTPGGYTVDFSNQDWWTTKKGYREHCKALSELLGAKIDAVECEEEDE